MKIYNTLSRQKEEFKPLKDKQVNMYVCGVTLYDEPHLGHGRAYVVFDLLYRYLEYRGYKVKYIQNFTDIDDKVINKARQEAPHTSALQEKVKEITERYKKTYFEVMDKLNIKRATKYPEATAHIPQMVRMIEALIAKGIAYEVGGDVYFSVDKFPSYGQLSRRKKEDMLPGARVKVEKGKKNPLDFALWKKSKEGEPYWESPWGKGRPGWHIECSVMSTEYLGATLDIHGGGEDLIFPHHENEIAQSESYTGKQFARFWIHNGFVKIEGEKMSKSLGNLFLLKELLKHYSPQTIRLFLISTHYRKPIDFSPEKFADFQNSWERIENAYLDAKDSLKKTPTQDKSSYMQRFLEALDNDLSTPEALAALFDLINALNQLLEKRDFGGEFCRLFRELEEMLDILGFPLPEVGELPPKLMQLIKKREEARRNKDFPEADRIREELLQQGIILKDTPEGTVWRKSSPA